MLYKFSCGITVKGRNMVWDKEILSNHFGVENGNVPFVWTVKRQIFLQNPCTFTAVECLNFATYMNYPVTPTTKYEKDKYSAWLFKQGMYLPSNIDTFDDYVECKYEIDNSWKELKDMVCILDVTNYYSSGGNPVIVSNKIIQKDGFDSLIVNPSLYDRMCINSLVSASSYDKFIIYIPAWNVLLIRKDVEKAIDTGVYVVEEENDMCVKLRLFGVKIKKAMWTNVRDIKVKPIGYGLYHISRDHWLTFIYNFGINVYIFHTDKEQECIPVSHMDKNHHVTECDDGVIVDTLRRINKKI